MIMVMDQHQHIKIIEKVEGFEAFRTPRMPRQYEAKSGVKNMSSEQMLPEVRMIVAMDQNQLIGAGNDLPWHLPLDLQLFKAKTLYQHILMGHNTFQSIIKRAGKPLPWRVHWVLTKQNISSLPSYPNVVYIPDIDWCFSDLMRICSQDFLFTAQGNYQLKQTHKNNWHPEQLWVIGGAQIYQLMKAQPLVDEIHITQLNKSFEGDAYFNMSAEDLLNWQLVEDKSLLDAYKSSGPYQERATSMRLCEELAWGASKKRADLISSFKLNLDLIDADLSEDEQQARVKIYYRPLKT